jgi:small-conductance mechanosensitive channel
LFELLGPPKRTEEKEMDNAAQKQDLLRRAFANLTSVRNNLPEKLVNQQVLYQQFDSALNQLEQAGENVNEWRRSDNHEPLHALEFKAKIDAILRFFTIKQENTQIGFHN